MSRIIDPKDNVNHPQHYNTGSIECIDGIVAAMGIDAAIDFCEGNVLKYAWRAKHKGKELEDMQKAAWYAQKAAELLEKKGFDNIKKQMERL